MHFQTEAFSIDSWTVLLQAASEIINKALAV
jgi:hypothetical protein